MNLSHPESLKHTILIVDDDKEDLDILKKLLSPQYNILLAPGGKEALEIIKKEENYLRIDLIIADQLMPIMTGLELFEKVKYLLPRAYRIILTGFSDGKKIMESVSKGHLYKYMLKPFDPESMKLAVQRALETYELEKQNLDLIQELQEMNSNLEKMVQDRTQELTKEILYREKELEQAKETQKCLLPYNLPAIPDVQISCKYTPMAEIGGDIYNLFELDKNQFGVMVTDVTGHGVPSALISFMISGIFMNNIRESTSPAVVMSKTNDMLHDKLQEGKFATMFYAVYNAMDRVLTYSTAGHPPGILIRKDTEQVIYLETTGMILGGFPSEIAMYEEKKIQLQPHDKILLYTDGITEVADDHNRMLNLNDLENFLEGHRDFSIEDLLEELYEFARKRTKDDVFIDDITLVGLELKNPKKKKKEENQ